MANLESHGNTNKVEQVLPKNTELEGLKTKLDITVKARAHLMRMSPNSPEIDDYNKQINTAQAEINAVMLEGLNMPDAAKELYLELKGVKERNETFTPYQQERYTEMVTDLEEQQEMGAAILGQDVLNGVNAALTRFKMELGDDIKPTLH